MAVALKCDICGNYFDYVQNKENAITICQRSQTGRTVITFDEYDACPECMNSIGALISTLKMNVKKKQSEDPDNVALSEGGDQNGIS